MVNFVYNKEDRKLVKATPEQDKRIAEFRSRTGSPHRVFEDKDGKLRGLGPTEGDIVIKDGVVRRPGVLFVQRKRG